MDSKNSDLAPQYQTLQEAVNQSSLHTNRQLGTINGYSYIGGFVLLLLVLGICYFLNIFEYWIPAGFILFYFLFFTAIRSIRKPFVHKDIKDVLKHYREKHSEVRYRIESSVQRNLSHVFQSLSILYLISFFILLSIEYNWINVDQSVGILIPSLTCLLFLPVPFFMKEFYQFLHPYELKATLQKTFEKHKQEKWKAVFSVEFINPLFFGLYLILLLVLPFVSFVLLSTILVEWPYLLLSFIFQCFIIILFANSFSANTVRKELTTTLTTFSDMNYLLTMAKIQNHYTSTEYQRLLTLYESAKPFDFIVNDTFKFINYYLLVPNRFYLKELLKHPREHTTEPLTTSTLPKKKKPVNLSSVQLNTPPPVSTFSKPQSGQPSFIPSTINQVSEPSMRMSLKSDKDIDNIKIGNVGILLYGPMVEHLSAEVKSATKKRIKGIKTPFKVELARKNDSFGGAPELIPVNSGGAQVNGELLVFKDKITERQALDMLYRMENHLEGTKKTYRKPSHPSVNDFVIKSIPDFYGVEKVLYPSTGRNIHHVTAEKLAKLTIDSVFNTDDNEADGFSYLMMLKKHNISTPMIEACEQTILDQTCSSNLFESRQKLEKVNEIKANI